MIKTSILSAVLMTSALLNTDAKAGLFNPFSDDIKVHSAAVKDVYSGIKFLYLNREDRLLILNDFLKSVELEYALLPLKEKRLGINFKKLKQEAIDAEMAVEDYTISAADRKKDEVREKVTALQAISNMEFLDRMLIVVSKFKDTHFGLSEKISRPFIYNGLRLFRVEGKIIVGSIDKKFISMIEKLSSSDFSGIKIGDEVVSIDGVNIEDKVNEYKPYVSGSSEEFIDMEAVRSVTLRNFKYEKKNFMKIAFKNGNVFKLPTYVNNSMQETPRLDAITFFNKFNIPSDSSSIGITYDKNINKWVDAGGFTFTGYSARNLKENLKGVTEYLDDAGGVGMRTGYYIAKGKTHAVMQLLTFSTKNLKNGEVAAPFLDVIRKFAIETKENEVPLILDIRVNGGGNGNFPAAVLGIFTEKDKSYGGPSRGYRVTSYSRTMEDVINYQMVEGEDQSTGLTYDDLRTIMDDALNEGKEYAPMYNAHGAVKADARVGGFEQKIVVLVTPNCISACDMTAFLFKASKRATLIGSTSNGTGAGFRSTSELNTMWSDPLRVFDTNIPNFLFGIPGADINKSVFGENSVEELCTENVPTVADIQYSNTMLDVTRGNLGWLQKAAQVIAEQK